MPEPTKLEELQAKFLKEILPEESRAALKEFIQKDNILPLFEILIYLQKTALQKMVDAKPEHIGFFQGSYKAYGNLQVLMISLLKSYNRKKKAAKLEEYKIKALMGVEGESLMKIIEEDEKRMENSDQQ